MIDPTPYKLCEPIEHAIILLREPDFLAFANKPENISHKFVNLEHHPEKPAQVIAHHFYVADPGSKQVFGYIQLAIPASEYEKIQDAFEE